MDDVIVPLQHATYTDAGDARRRGAQLAVEGAVERAAVVLGL